MTTVPQGLPAWVRANNFVTYGGDPNKKNFASRGLINPKTDVGAEGFSRLVADVAALQRVADFCVIQIICDADVGGAPIVESCRLMTAVTAAPYTGTTPPAGFPTVTRNGDGDVTLEFDTSYVDEYGVEGTLILRSPVATLLADTAGVANPELVGSFRARVRCVDLSAAALSGARFTLTLGSGG